MIRDPKYKATETGKTIDRRIIKKTNPNWHLEILSYVTEGNFVRMIAQADDAIWLTITKPERVEDDKI